MNQPGKSMSPTTSIPPWSELPQELLGLIIDRLPGSSGDRGLLSAAWSKVRRFLLSMASTRAQFREACRPSRHSASADCARFRAVCRSWKTALREHMRVPAPRQVPWIVLSDGYLLTPDGTDPLYRLPSLPEDATCIGSTDEWLAIDRIGPGNQHSYFMHNPFSGTTVPLHELRNIIRERSKFFKIHKVLMRSTPDDVIAVLTNNWNYPLILIRPGKGAWTPKPRTPPYVYIIDIAFLGDELYGITQAYDLVSLAIAFDSNGIPSVAGIDRLIWHTPMDYHFHVWDDDEEDGEYERKMATNPEASEDDDDKRAVYELMKSTGDSMIMDAVHWWDDEEVPHEPKDLVTVSWHFVESRGKLLLVMRQLQIPEYTMKFTRKVQVFEAKVNAGGWVPVTSGLDGQALFISRPFCKSIPAHGEIEADVIHFVDTGDMFNMRSQTMGPPTRGIYDRSSTWIFFSELVV
ncbi:hypothetical protein CFC21_027335 [Triticum aestivum]|uniref:KIB1-4 beta-propeller domain-containing protein n=2 Tax=Triticum aestivum TaxID=4565 RepID=A0A9R1EN35_WHEAT|nr:hypothetical protein CFC21_027335 [Triticum aestivum]